jgi:hypothetical protein
MKAGFPRWIFDVYLPFRASSKYPPLSITQGYLCTRKICIRPLEIRLRAPLRITSHQRRAQSKTPAAMRAFDQGCKIHPQMTQIYAD